MKKNSAFSHPNVEWGAFVVAVVLFLETVALIVINISVTLIYNLPINDLFACALITSLIPLYCAYSLFFKKFVPSFTKYKEYKAKMNYVQSLGEAVQKSLRSNERTNERRNNAIYKKFLEENPKYKA